MRRSAIESRLAASRLATLPRTFCALGRAASLSHASACGHIVGRPLHLSQLPPTLTLRTLGKLRLSPMRWPAEVVGQPRPSAAPLVAAPRRSIPRRITLGQAASSSPPLRPSRPASDRGRSASSVNPITNDPRRGCRAGQLLKGGVHARQRGPSPLTAGPPALTTHPNAQGSFPSGDGPSSLPASGRRPEATQHNRRRTDR